MSTDTRVESAGELLADFVMCRTIRHAWFPYSNGEVDEDGVEVISLACERCNTKRLDYRYVTGNLYYRRYEYPENYRLSREVTNDNLWAEFLVRRKNGEIRLKRRAGRPKAS